MTPDHAALLPLATAVHEVAETIGHDTSALDLYRRARDVARQRLPGPLGDAIAAVLGLEAYERAESPFRRGALGSRNDMVALALAVLALPDAPPPGPSTPES